MPDQEKGAERLMAMNRTTPPVPPPTLPLVRKFATQVEAGLSDYTIVHNLGSRAVIVQTSIAGRVREGGISILDENRIHLTFGGRLNEPIDVVVIG